MKPGDVYRKGQQFATVISVGDRVGYKLAGRAYKLKRENFEKRFIPVDLKMLEAPEIKTDGLRYFDCHDDFGEFGLEFECPVCGMTVRWTEITSSVKLHCACRQWSVEISATGTPLDNETTRSHF